MRFVPTVMIALALGLAAGGAGADQARVTVTFAQHELRGWSGS